MMKSNKELVLILLAGLGMFYFLGRQKTAAAQAPALSPAANANRIAVGRAMMGVPDVMALLGRIRPTTGAAYPDDWVSSMTGTSGLNDMPLTSPVASWPSASDPYGITPALGFITGGNEAPSFYSSPW
jgi:hypothetical protein